MTDSEALKKYFGFDSFRGGQAELITAVSDGRDVLGVMPTGAGKSVCYQLPAVTHDGITLVISPLISLMKDQVGALAQAGIPSAYINSTLTPRQMESALYNAGCGKYKLIYVAPERLTSPDFIEFAQSTNIFMLAVDEAHCISQWGQDFRPSYAQIPQFIAQLATRPIVSAFTATATSQVRDDIVELLGLQNPLELVTGFDRQNLYFEVRAPHDKFAELTAFLKTQPGKSGIVYCSTRKTVEEVCEELNSSGFPALRYHAGLSDVERHNNQDDFLYDRAQIMVATNAFGMGIDKSNVSFVVHYNMPKDIESYYQEAGRAGRDGSPAVCLLLYSGQDVVMGKWLIDHGSEGAELDAETARLLRERNHARLRQMTFYCTGSDCLRAFILRYFGENPPDFCGGCGNCDSDAEPTDVTVDAQMILSCVTRMRNANSTGAYGAGLVADVLLGKESERVRTLGFDRLSTFCISKRDPRELRAIIGFLVRRGYLIQDNGEYPVLRLTDKSPEALSGKVKLDMKLPQLQERTAHTRGERADTGRKASLRGKNAPLANPDVFEKLKALRRELADRQGVPAFVIFTDATLREMSALLPTSNEEFLRVPGVGAEKLKRYGEQFISEIAKYKSNGVISEKPHATISPVEMEFSEKPVMVSEFADLLNIYFAERSLKKLTAHKISDWLVSIGILQLYENAAVKYKIPTERGKVLGITSETRSGPNGDYAVNLYNTFAQRYIYDHAADIASFKPENKDKK